MKLPAPGITFMFAACFASMLGAAEPGDAKTVRMTLSAEQLAFYDVKTHAFVVEPGAFDVIVGSSSRDNRGKGQIEVTALAR